MSPYIWFAIVMLGVVVASILLTGNLAATFNERAKSDLKLALEPLAAKVDGTIALDEALVTGRYHGQITMAQVVAGPGGMGRLFRTSMVEAAGGESWKAVVTRPKDASAAWERSFDGDAPLSLAAPIHILLDGLLPFPGWFELNYDQASGTLALTRAMQSRRDIPTPERFAAYLTVLENAAAANRAVQAGTDS